MTRTTRLASIALVTGAAFALPAIAPAQKIIVNEFNRTTGSLSSGLLPRDEWVEYLIVEDVTAAELNGYYVGDSQAARNNKLSSEQFTNMEDIAPVFYAGTLIVITGDEGEPEDLSYDPFNGDWNITLVSSAVSQSANLTRIRAGWDYAANDVAWIDTNDEIVDATSAISPEGFGVAYSSSSGALGSTCNVVIGTPANTGAGDPPVPYTTAALMGNLAGATDSANWDVAADPTPGQPNGGANTAYIMALRDEVVLLVELESFTASAAHAGAPVDIAWVTASEIDTVGFRVHRAEGGAVGAAVSDSLIPAQGSASSGASYSLVDPVAIGDARRDYFLVELEANGATNTYGPFRATVGGSPSLVGEWPTY